MSCERICVLLHAQLTDSSELWREPAVSHCGWFNIDSCKYQYRPVWWDQWGHSVNTLSSVLPVTLAVTDGEIQIQPADVHTKGKAKTKDRSW